MIGFFMTYLALLSLLAYRERNSKCPAASKKRSFAIVVPAYNEEEALATTLRKLSGLDYPENKFDIIVVADNCSDHTADVAEKEGAKVLIRNNPGVRGKGYALRWCFDKLIQNNDVYNYDAVVVVDADSMVENNLLDVMNNYLEQGGQVIQGYLAVNSRAGVWTSEIIQIGFMLYNYVRPLGRRAVGFPGGLRGNGMCFSMDVLKRVPWDAYSLTEDLEYGLKLLLNEVDVVFAPKIIGYNVMPQNAKNAESQRERWEIGRYPVLARYSGKLLKKAIKKRSLKIFDALVDLVTPPVVNMTGFALLMAGVSFTLWWAGVETTLLFFWLWLGVIGLGIFHTLLGLYVANAGWTTYRSLFYTPKYALWKVYIYSKVLLFKGRTNKWVRTSRES